MPLLALDAAPATAIGGEAGLTARYRWLSLSAGMRGDAPASAAVPQGGSVGTWLLAATVAPCVRGPLGLWFCGLAEVGEFVAQGHVSNPHQASDLSVAAGARLRLEVPLSSNVAFVSHLDGLASITRYDVDVNGSTAYRLPAFSGALGAGLALSF
jgi:hypothetical protein